MTFALRLQRAFATLLPCRLRGPLLVRDRLSVNEPQGRSKRMSLCFWHPCAMRWCCGGGGGTRPCRFFFSCDFARSPRRMRAHAHGKRRVTLWHHRSIPVSPKVRSHSPRARSRPWHVASKCAVGVCTLPVRPLEWHGWWLGARLRKLISGPRRAARKSS